eukprot:428512-Prymnesium_polylepis.1
MLPVGGMGCVGSWAGAATDGHSHSSPPTRVPHRSQDECAFHGNDDVPYEWCEGGKMSLKQKSRGPLLMVSDYLSQLNGSLRCSPAERDAYIA